MTYKFSSTYDLFLHTVFLSVFKSTNSCFRNQDILCVCTWRAHTNTTNILSYSFSHSVELPLGFTGVVLYLHHLCETVTFTRNNLDTVRTTFQFTGAKAVPAHYSEFYGVYFLCFFVVFYLSSASLQGSKCIWLCIQIKHMPFTFHQRYGQTTFSKSFQYLKITFLLLHSSFHACSSGSACKQVVRPASQPMKENVII